jgi:hypothetical protein
MKLINITILIAIFFTINQIQPINAQITRGASPGEIYISTDWYLDNYGQVHYAIFHSTDNGENITLKYENIENPPTGEMQVGKVIGDVTPGALYNYGNNELWVSFDYGESWEYREDFIDYIRYWGGYEGIIYKGGWGLLHKSNDYALTYEVVSDPPNCPISDVGHFDAEFFGIDGNAGEGFYLYHTIDYANTYTEIPIDSSVAYWSIGGYWPQISRGTQLGEIYLVSWWTNSTYKIFHSIDTGYNWTEKFESDYINIYYWRVFYTAGREPGSFYVMRSRINPAGDHIWLYIDYSTDYGVTFTTYFHDLDSTFTGINKLYLQHYELKNYPNPFKLSSKIEFYLAEESKVKIELYNLLGEKIQTITDKYYTKGKHEILLNSDGFKTGVYYCTVKLNGALVEGKKMMKIE